MKRLRKPTRKRFNICTKAEGWALDSFKKADKEDGGNCLACQKQMIKYGRELGEWKAAELAVEEMVSQQGTKGCGRGALPTCGSPFRRRTAKAQG